VIPPIFTVIQRKTRMLVTIMKCWFIYYAMGTYHCGDMSTWSFSPLQPILFKLRRCDDHLVKNVLVVMTRGAARIFLRGGLKLWKQKP